MSDETGLAITKAIYTKITTDATMKTVLGTPIRLYRAALVPTDPDMPYLVYRMAFGSPLLHGVHTYMLDLWDYSASPATVDAAVDRLKILLTEQGFNTGNNEANVLIEWFSGGDIPTDAVNVLHYATQWTVWVGAARDITNIIEG